MRKLSRTQASLINSTVATVAQTVQLIVQFVSRSVFIYTLGSQYLGLNGLFQNVLGYLNFAELGIGSAITFSLYKPLNNNDFDEVSSILKLFRKIYRIIALVVLVVGIIVTPIVPHLIGGSHQGIGVNVRIAFLLALADTVLSYITTYKRTLLIADQRGYVNTVNTVWYNVVGQIIQIVQLLVYKNFYMYLIIQAVMMFASNIHVSHVVDRMYPSLSINKARPVDTSVIRYLKKNITGMISAKIGGILVTGTDNILLSYYVGLRAVGLYSNYLLIINGLNMVINQLISAVSSSIGSLGASSASNAHQERVFYQYFMISSFISVIIATGFAGFSSAFINVWLSRGMVYTFLPLTVLAVNFLLQGLRQSLINYANAYGLYWYERWKSLFEATSNLLISWFLVKYTSLAISGILVGTICSNLLINFVWESHIVLKYGLHIKQARFLRLYAAVIIAGTLAILFSTYGVRLWATVSLQRGIILSILSELIAIGLFFLVDAIFYPKDVQKIQILSIFKKIRS